MKEQDPREKAAAQLASREAAKRTFEALQKRPASIAELEEMTGFSKCAIQRVLSIMITLEIVDFRRFKKARRREYFLTLAAERLGKLEIIVTKPTWKKSSYLATFRPDETV